MATYDFMPLFLNSVSSITIFGALENRASTVFPPSRDFEDSGASRLELDSEEATIDKLSWELSDNTLDIQIPISGLCENVKLAMARGGFTLLCVSYDLRHLVGVKMDIQYIRSFAIISLVILLL